MSRFKTIQQLFRLHGAQAVSSQLALILQNQGIIMTDLTALQASEAKLIANVEALKAERDALRADKAKAVADLQAAKDALAAALAANDPAAAKAVQDQIDQIATDLSAEADSIAPADAAPVEPPADVPPAV